MNIYPKYDPKTYFSRDLFRIVCETGDLRPVWAKRNAEKWKVDYDAFLSLCEETCSCCGHKLNYGLGKNNVDKSPEETPSTDHIIPRSKGGTDDIANLWVICNKCNTLKNNATFEDIQRYENIIKILKENAPAP